MGIQVFTSRPRRAVAACPRRTSREITKATSREKSAARAQGAQRRPQQLRPHHLALPRRRSQAALPHHRLQARQDRRARQGRGDRVRSEPHRAHRAAALRRRREALHPRARRPRASATRCSSARNADIKPGNCLPLRFIPLGTTIHNVELKIGNGGQLGPLGRHRGAADGEGRRLGAGPPAVGRGPPGAPRLPRHRSARSATSSTPTSSRQGRPHALARAPPAQPRRHMNPVDHPMGGGEGRTSGGRHPCSPWGQLAKGLKTRNNKRTDAVDRQRRRK